MSEETNELKRQMKELSEKMEQFQKAIAPLEETHTRMQNAEKAAYQDYMAQVAKIRAERNKIDEALFEARSGINSVIEHQRKLERQITETEKREKEAQRAAELEAEYKALNEKWDLLTAGLPWREWAKDHQIKGGHKIVEDRKVILADGMGLGKTLTSIIAADMAEAATREASPDHPFLGELKDVYVQAHRDPETNEWIAGEWEPQIVGGVTKPSGKKVLYFCPNSLLRNVEKEWRMWAPRRSVVIIGGLTKMERKFVFDTVLPQHPEWVVICNYEAWRKDLSLIDSLISLDFDTVIIDESHNIKDTKSIAYRGIKRLVDELKPSYVIPMTGTPILNRPQELFSQLTLVDPEKFYNLNSFLFNYCEQDEEGFWRFKPGGLDALAPKIRKNFLRRTKADAGIELPPKTITIHNIEVDTEAYPHQAKVRKQMAERAMIMLDEREGKAIAAAAMIAVFTRLRQIETWPAGIKVIDPVTKEVKLQVDVEESQKIDYTIKWDPVEKEWDGLIPSFIGDERGVLFSQFKAPLHEIKDRITRMGKRAVILDGDTPKDLAEEIKVDFDNRNVPNREDAKWDIVLCNYKVGGVGLNFTAATQMVILDEEWNPGKRDQAYDRIHRLGQDKPVTIHVIRNAKTIDDWLAHIMETKEDIVTGFNNAMVDKDEFKKFLEGMEGDGIV